MTTDYKDDRTASMAIVTIAIAAFVACCFLIGFNIHPLLRSLLGNEDSALFSRPLIAFQDAFGAGWLFYCLLACISLVGSTAGLIAGKVLNARQWPACLLALAGITQGNTGAAVFSVFSEGSIVSLYLAASIFLWCLSIAAIATIRIVDVSGLKRLFGSFRRAVGRSTTLGNAVIVASAMSLLIGNAIVAVIVVQESSVLLAGSVVLVLTGSAWLGVVFGLNARSIRRGITP